MWGPRAEPAVWAEVIRQVIYLLLIFEVIHWTSAQETAVIAFVSVLLTALTRQSSMPTITVHEAGTTPQQLKNDAAINRAAIEDLQANPPKEPKP